MMPDGVFDSVMVLGSHISDAAQQLTRCPVPGLQELGIWTDKLVFFPLWEEMAPNGLLSHWVLVPVEQDLTSSAGAPVFYPIAGRVAEAKQGLREKVRRDKPAAPSQTVMVTVPVAS